MSDDKKWPTIEEFMGKVHELSQVKRDSAKWAYIYLSDIHEAAIAQKYSVRLPEGYTVNEEAMRAPEVSEEEINAKGRELAHKLERHPQFTTALAKIIFGDGVVTGFAAGYRAALKRGTP